MKKTNYTKTILVLVLTLILSVTTVIAMEQTSAATGRNPQTGKEIQIPASHAEGDEPVIISAKAQIFANNEEYYADAKINMIELFAESIAEYRCGVSRNNEIICEVTPYDGSDETRIESEPTLYCWGNNEVRECPREEITQSAIAESRGSGAGKVSVQDISVKSAEHEEEIEVLAWSWGASSSRALETTDPDYDQVELDFVWIVNTPLRQSDDDKPTETLSLSFTKIELAFSNEEGRGSIELSLPDLEVSENALIFTSVTFDEFAFTESQERCRVSSLLDSNDCDDRDPEVRPGTAVDEDASPEAEAKRELEAISRIISSIQLSLERCELDVCRQVGANADKRHELIEKAKDDIINSPPVVSEARSIVLEDIEALERCEAEVCREVLAQERELLRTINNYLDLDSDGDGIPELKDEDEAVLTIIERSPRVARHLDKATPFLFSARRGDEFDEEDKQEILEYLSSLNEIRGRDLGLSIALLASENPRIKEIRYNEEASLVEIEHEEEVRLLGFIKMNVRAHTTIDEQGREETKMPWWTALATKSKDRVRFKAGADISKSVN